MFLGRITPNFAACIVLLLIIVLLAATLWYYKSFIKPYAMFPSYRLEFRIPYWLLTGRQLDIVLLRAAEEQSKIHKKEGLYIAWFVKPTLVVFGEEIIKSIFQDSDASYKPSALMLFNLVIKKSIFLSEGERWKKQKKVISPAFYTRALKPYVSVMNRHARALVQGLTEKKGKDIEDMNHVLSYSTLRLFYESSLGVTDGDSKEDGTYINDVQKIIEFVVGRFFRPWLYLDFTLHIFPYGRQLLKLSKESKTIITKVLEQIKESVLSRDQSQVKEQETDALIGRLKTLGEILIEDRLKLPSFSMEELTEEIIFLIAAGFDTTSHALMWALFALGQHQEIQDRVYDEISSLTKEDIEYSDVQDLTYLECVLKESLRMYGVPFILRRVTKDVHWGDYVIPKNTEITFCLSLLHHNPDIYPEPDKFKPERFMEENSKIKPWNYIPFMEGCRPCLGKKYAMLSMKIYMVHVLRKFKVVSIDRDEDMTYKWSLVLGSEKDPRIKFIPRHEILT